MERRIMYRVLGQLALDEGRLNLPGGNQLTVLALLLINPNKRVARQDLIRRTWGSLRVQPIQLDKQASHVRLLLDRVGRRDDLITHKGYGYELRCAEEDHDMLLFERLVRDAETAGGPGGAGAEVEVELLRRALKLWRGHQPLEGVPGDFIPSLGADLVYRRKRAVVRLAELEMVRGRYADVLGELRSMVGVHPTDKRLCEQLMLALYHTGHGNEALDVYEAYAAALDRSTGAPADTELRTLKYAIARGDGDAIDHYEGVDPAAPRRPGQPARPVVVPRQLPPAPGNFVGREPQINESRWLLSRHDSTAPPVVVVSGSAGIGKTALVTQVAHLVREQYPGGQLFLELGGTRPEPVAPAELLAQVLRAYGVSAIPETRDERVALFRSLLAEQAVLLVLDDARDEAQVRDLIPGNPACGVLVTARKRLPDLAGAHHMAPIQPLADPDAVELFERIVHNAGLGPQERHEVQAVVRQCAGLPLAICVAGALRAEDGGPSTAELARRLADQRLGCLVYGDRSVERSIGAGFDQLDPAARQLFLHLGVLELPEIAVWTAAAVLDDAADPTDALRRLVAAHLLQPVGDGRYRFHDLTRELAARMAVAESITGAAGGVLEHVYGALLTLARRAHAAIYGGDYELVHGHTPDWKAPDAVLHALDGGPLAWFEIERTNIRAAVRHAAEVGLTELCWDLAVSAHEFYGLRHYLDDWEATHQIALAACRRERNQRGEAILLAILGQPALIAGGRPGVSGIDDLTRAAELFAGHHDRHGEAIAQRTLGNALRRAGRFDAALSAFSQALRLYEQSGDYVGRWQTLRYIGQTHLDLEHYPTALTMLRRAEQVARHAGQARLVAQTANWLGRAYLAGADVGNARAAFQEVLLLVGDADHTGRAYAYHGLGDVAVVEHDLTEARRCFQLAIDSALQGRDVVLEGRVYLSLAELTLPEQDAISALEHASVCFTTANASYLRDRALARLASAAGSS
jgi:tetratricopeptide (TPR) repeat protein/DNA-binding SARP family transcriptional activator